MGIEKLNTFLVNLETVLRDIDKEKISIRPYRSGELAHIANRHSALYRLECDLGDIFESYLIQGMARFLDESAGKGQIWVIDYWGTVQGSIGIVETEPDTAQLRWFLIEPEFRGLGLGRILMETCLNYCSEKGCRKVYLWTFDELDAARHLYKIFGFRVTEIKTYSPESFGLPFSVQFYFCPVFSRALSKVTLSLYSSFLPLFHCETGERNPTTLE